MWMKAGMLPRKSSKVCNFTAALVERYVAHGNSDRQSLIRSGIECVDRLFEFQPKWLLDIESPRSADELLREIRIDAPIARFVGVGQRAARHVAMDAQVIELRTLSLQTSFDVAQAFPVRQLCKRHAAKLVGTAEMPYSMIATIALHDSSKTLPRKMIHELGEHQFADEHVHSLRWGKPQIRALRRSSRGHPEHASLLY